jgi:hypothetical protein
MIIGAIGGMKIGITELDEGHQLAHARTPGMEKTFRAFLSDDINRIRV